MDWKKYGEEINQYLRLNTFPFGIKLCKTLDELPPGARKRRFRIDVCQQGFFARAYGWTLYSEKEDMNCVLGACACGLIPCPKRVTDGILGEKVYQKDLQAAADMQKEMTKLDPIYKAVATFPLRDAKEGYDPDVIMMYVNSAQCMRLTQAALWEKGGALVVPTVGDAGMCSTGIAYVMKTQGIIREVPCLGDRRFAGCQDHELVFSYHKSQAQQILDGLIGTHKGGVRYPIPTAVEEFGMPPGYFVEVQDLMNLKGEPPY
jgi:uncharacterized protein (DUF169 family)